MVITTQPRPKRGQVTEAVQANCVLGAKKGCGRLSSKQQPFLAKVDVRVMDQGGLIHYKRCRSRIQLEQGEESVSKVVGPQGQGTGPALVPTKT